MDVPESPKSLEVFTVSSQGSGAGTLLRLATALSSVFDSLTKIARTLRGFKTRKGAKAMTHY